jgi:hypothetical protein
MNTKLTSLLQEIFNGSKLAEVGGVVSTPPVGQVAKKPATPTTAPATEPATPAPAAPAAAQVYNPAVEMQSFESEIAKSIEIHEKNIKARLLNKTVTARASKGYGQVEKDYTFVVVSASIVLFKEDYHLVLRDKEKKEYYVNTNTKIKVS